MRGNAYDVPSRSIAREQCVWGRKHERASALCGNGEIQFRYTDIGPGQVLGCYAIQ